MRIKWLLRNKLDDIVCINKLIIIHHNHQLTSTRPKMMPAAIVPMPAMKKGIDTCNVICHHFSCLMPGKSTICLASSPPNESPPTPSAAPSPSPPLRRLAASGSDEAMLVVMIELSEPVVEPGKTDNLSLSPANGKKIWRLS